MTDHPVFRPSREFSSGAHVKSLEEYRELYRQSIVWISSATKYLSPQPGIPAGCRCLNDCCCRWAADTLPGEAKRKTPKVQMKLMRKQRRLYYAESALSGDGRTGAEHEQRSFDHF